MGPHVVEVQGTKVPALGLGTWLLTGEACAEAVETALKLGYRHVDTAQAYANEEAVGIGLRRSGVDRELVFVATKLWYQRLSYDHVLRGAEESLAKLKTGWIDLLMIHWPSPHVPLERTLDAMMVLQRDGRVRHLGVANFPPELLDRARRHAPILGDQVELHPFLQQRDLAERAPKQDFLLTAYSPLARGRVLADPTLVELGRRHDKTPAQIALRWLLQQRNVAAIPKASTREHLRENLSVFDFTLGEEALRRIAALDRGERLIDPAWAPWGRTPIPH